MMFHIGVFVDVIPTNGLYHDVPALARSNAGSSNTHVMSGLCKGVRADKMHMHTLYVDCLQYMGRMLHLLSVGD
jgi:hypothetical protein